MAEDEVPEYKRLGAFMNGLDRPTFARMITFFSVPGKYLHPREIEHFRNSMTDEEWIDFKVEFWSHMDSINEVRRLMMAHRHTIKEVSEILGVPRIVVQTLLVTA